MSIIQRILNFFGGSPTGQSTHNAGDGHLVDMTRAMPRRVQPPITRAPAKRVNPVSRDDRRSFDGMDVTNPIHPANPINPIWLDASPSYDDHRGSSHHHSPSHDSTPSHSSSDSSSSSSSSSDSSSSSYDSGSSSF